MERRAYELGGDFRFEPGRRILERSGTIVPLPARAHDLLALLVQERHRPLSKEDLCAEVWMGVAVTPNNLNQCITALRKAFGDSRQSSRFIATIPHVGYQFVADVRIVDLADEQAPCGPPALQESPKPHGVRRRLVACGACVLLTCLLVASKWQNAAVTEIAVAPLMNLQKDDEFNWLSNALRDQAAAMFLHASENSTSAPYQLLGSFSIPSEGQIRIRVELHESASGQTVGAAEGSSSLAGFASLTSDLTLAANRTARLAIEPPNDRAYAEGIDAWNRGDLQMASALLRRAVTQNPQQAMSLSALGAVLFELGHTAEARLLQQRSKDFAANVPESARTVLDARYHASMGNWSQAIPGFTSAWNRHPDQVGAALELAQAQFRSKRTVEARSTLETLAHFVQPSASDPRVLLLSARIAGQLGEMTKVRELAARAAEVSRIRGLRLLQGRAGVLEAGALQNLGKFDEAVQLRTAARSLCKSISDGVCVSVALRVEANLAVGRKDWKHALVLYRQALQITRVDGNTIERLQVINGLGNALMVGGHYREAELLYRTARQSDLVLAGLHPAWFSNSLAEALLCQGKLREAENHAMLAVQHGKSTGDQESAASGYLLVALARAGNPANGELFVKALESFRKVQNPEKTRKALLEYAKFLSEQGARREAAKQLREAKALSTPLHTELMAALEREIQKGGRP